MSEPPILPYGGQDHPNSGYAGSEASRERAERDDADGTTSRRQRAVLRHLGEYRGFGVTYNELGLRLGLHHGQSSGVLSGLHKAGLIVRLAEKRHRCHVYVLPDYVNGRETQPAGRVARPGLGPVAAEMARVLREIVVQGWMTSHAQHDAQRILNDYDRIERQ